MTKPPYWFPAKRYGGGWGAPSAWQGGVALLAFIAMLSACASLFPPGVHPHGFEAGTGVLGVALPAACLFKGEPAAWRWGR